MMNRFRTPILASLLALVISCCLQAASPDRDDRLFELRVYYPNPGKMEALNDRFRDHTLSIFEKHGMEHIGYWVSQEEEPKLVYLIAFESKAARGTAWKNFSDDPEWKAAFAESTKDGGLVLRIDSTLLRLTDFSPAIVQKESKPERVFELCTYKAAPGRLVNLDARFRDHTMELFSKHGATNLVYFHVAEDEEGADDTLIYLLAHDSREAGESSFEGFRSAPDWLKARAESESAAGGSLTLPGGVTNVFLNPTDYSKIK